MRPGINGGIESDLVEQPDGPRARGRGACAARWLRQHAAPRPARRNRVGFRMATGARDLLREDIDKGRVIADSRIRLTCLRTGGVAPRGPTAPVKLRVRARSQSSLHEGVEMLADSIDVVAKPRCQRAGRGGLVQLLKRFENARTGRRERLVRGVVSDRPRPECFHGDKCIKVRCDWRIAHEGAAWEPCLPGRRLAVTMMGGTGLSPAT